MKKAIIVVLLVVLVIGGVLLMTHDGDKLTAKLWGRPSPVVVSASSTQMNVKLVPALADKASGGQSVVLSSEGKPLMKLVSLDEGALRVLAPGEGSKISPKFSISKAKTGDAMMVWDVRNKAMLARINPREDGFVMVKRGGDNVRYNVRLDSKSGGIVVRKVGEPGVVWRIQPAANRAGKFNVRSGDKKGEALGDVLLDEENSRAVVRGGDGQIQYRVKDAAQAKAFAALLFGMPQEDKEVILAELYRRAV